MLNIAHTIAQELQVKPQQVNAAVALLDDGATVPFIARYRKEITGALDDSQLRKLDDRLRYLRELLERQQSILKSIQEQGKLTASLQQQIESTHSKNELEDLYLPYKPKRRTKGQIAIEAGLEPLADKLFLDPNLEPSHTAEAFLNPEHKIDTIKDALEGAKFILMERFSEDAALLGKLRTYLWQHGLLESKLAPGQAEKGEKFRDYFDYAEAINTLPSHRALAVFRGRNEGILNLSLRSSAEEHDDPKRSSPCEAMIADHFALQSQQRPADAWLQEVIRWCWRIKLSNHLETELFGRLRDAAEGSAIDVFAANLKDLLMAAPAGPQATIGLDPGLRTGVKLAVVDATGKLLDHATIYPHAPQKQWQQALETIAQLARKHQIKLLSIGNGTASRETEKLAAEVTARYPELGLTRIMVSEAGASVYSASEFAATEFPDLDVTIRGAVSIARRLQDPLAELVKIEPKAIGVGQYQHDVSQAKLNRSLNAVVEDCVNAVGVDLNTASAPLLARVAGLNTVLASNIVAFRDSNGPFADRASLKAVSRLGEKTFEQAAGFLRIRGGNNPLDASAVHPESYAVVERIAQQSMQSLSNLVGNASALKQLRPEQFVDESIGKATVEDIFSELAKPGRDPRPEFKFAAFTEGVEKISDLNPGMVLEGAVTNVTHFGAFVDIGVHQDGLVHISALADRFVKDPRDVVKTGDIVKVKVMEVDPARKRIGLSMRLADNPAPSSKQGQRDNPPPTQQTQGRSNKRKPSANAASPLSGAMAQAFAKLKP